MVKCANCGGELDFDKPAIDGARYCNDCWVDGLAERFKADPDAFPEFVEAFEDCEGHASRLRSHPRAWVGHFLDWCEEQTEVETHQPA